MTNIITALTIIITALVSILFFGFVLSLPVMLLWNGCLVDAITGVKEITWLQGWGISILCGVLFNKNSSK